MKSFIVVGCGFGDEGKGTTIDYLCRNHKVHTVVRFSGGPNAAHNVVTKDGKHHCFSQFGSGSLAGALTHLSRFMLVDPLALTTEGEHLRSLGVRDIFERVTLEEGALIVTPYHGSLNRVRELSRVHLTGQRHGSCGVGINEAIVDSERCPEGAIRAKDLLSEEVLRSKLAELRFRLGVQMHSLLDDLVPNDSTRREEELFCDDSLLAQCVDTYTKTLKRGVRVVEGSYLSSVLQKGMGGLDTVVFEGSQGVLLDEVYGFYPYVTRSRCTFENALELLLGIEGEVTKIGVTRSYHTRHGAGPMPTEGGAAFPEPHNQSGEWQGHFRSGPLDLVLLRYAQKALGGIDEVSVTHLDLPKYPQIVCNSYITRSVPVYNLATGSNLAKWDKGLYPGYNTVKSEEELIQAIEKALQAPVTIKSYGQTTEDKKYAKR